MKCADCDHWIIAHRSIYDDCSLVTWRGPDGKGHCHKLDIDTAPDFGCVAFTPATGTHEIVTVKPGEPWQHHHDIPCPDCGGTGCVGGTTVINRWACHRCCGCGRVREYDDGYIGEEKTRLHPKEKAFMDAGQPIPPLPGTVLAPVKKPDAADTGGTL